MRRILRFPRPEASPSRDKIRTFWDVTVLIGIPFSRWGAQPFVTQPFLYPAGCAERMMDRRDSVDRIPKGTRHPIHLALEWHGQMKDDPALTRAQSQLKRDFRVLGLRK